MIEIRIAPEMRKSSSQGLFFFMLWDSAMAERWVRPLNEGKRGSSKTVAVHSALLPPHCNYFLTISEDGMCPARVIVIEALCGGNSGRDLHMCIHIRTPSLRIASTIAV